MTVRLVVEQMCNCCGDLREVIMKMIDCMDAPAVPTNDGWAVIAEDKHICPKCVKNNIRHPG